MSDQKKLFLLDAMALIYRAYFAFSRNPRINSRGMNTSAILGFANTLAEVLKKENPSHIAVAFDLAGPTIRESEYQAYKATRQETPEDIVNSLPYIKRLLQGFRIPVLEKQGYEADDIIGTLARKAEKDGYMVYMMTPDKDFGQLVSDRIFIYKPSKMGDAAEIWGVREVCEKFGIERPEQLIDILGLWGDSSDNIPGVPGIGEKKAKILISEFGSIDNLLANLDQVKEKRSRESLLEHADQARMSRNLATIMMDVPVEWDEESFRTSHPDPDILLPLFEELEFRAFARRVLGDQQIIPQKILKESKQVSSQIDLFSSALVDEDPSAAADKQLENLLKNKAYQAITDPDQAKILAERLSKVHRFCFDTETTGLEITENELVGIAFAYHEGEAWYVPFPENQEKARELARLFAPVFENEDIEKIGQNLKFDISVLKGYGIEVKGKLFDTMLAHYLLQPDMRHNMDVLAETYLDYRPVGIESLIGPKGRNQKSMRSVPLEKITAYACEDADVTYRLQMVFEPMLKEKGLLALFERVETPLVPVLAEMERQGVKVDKKALEDYAMVLDERIRDTEIKVHELAGMSFNIGSPKQLGEILFERLKIVSNAKKTKTKQYSTSEDVLSKLADKHPIVNLILDYRSLTKLKSTYVDVLPNLINPKTGRVHTSYNQAVAATGRLSSNNPNLQNIPIRTEEGRLIRRAFVPRSAEYTLLAADYSQIELRIIASLSGDESMIDAFNQGHDIHAATAARVYGVHLEEVTREMRRNAKTVNFGIIYGISAFGLSERLNIPRREAADIIDQYFLKYPGIARYMEKTIAFARKHEYVTTLLGRRRYIKDINSSNNVVRGYAERNAINAPIQGSAADMIKIAMINIHQDIKKMDLKSRMILQVHDELVFDAHKKELSELQPLIGECMKKAMTLKVPVVVDMNTGENWLVAH